MSPNATAALTGLLAPPYDVVANLPYHVTSPVLHRLLGEPPPPERLVLMVQREVAERLAAPPGEMSQAFAAAGIEVVFQHYEHPVYPQLFGEFTSHLSVLDLVLNCGAEGISVLRSGRR